MQLVDLTLSEGLHELIAFMCTAFRDLDDESVEAAAFARGKARKLQELANIRFSCVA